MVPFLRAEIQPNDNKSPVILSVASFFLNCQSPLHERTFYISSTNTEPKVFYDDLVLSTLLYIQPYLF
jgi:hypothetical protein